MMTGKKITWTDELIKQIYNLYDELENAFEVAFLLNKKDIKMPNGKYWTGTQIYKILQYKYLCIPDDLYKKIQKKLRNKNIISRANVLLKTGLANSGIIVGDKEDDLTEKAIQYLLENAYITNTIEEDIFLITPKGYRYATQLKYYSSPLSSFAAQHIQHRYEIENQIFKYIEKNRQNGLSVDFKERAEMYSAEEIRKHAFLDFKLIYNLVDYILGDYEHVLLLLGGKGYGKTFNVLKALDITLSQKTFTPLFYILNKETKQIEILPYEHYIVDEKARRIIEQQAKKKDIDLYVFDDIHYIFDGVIERKFDLEFLLNYLNMIINVAHEGKKVILISENTFNYYNYIINDKRLEDTLYEMGVLRWKTVTHFLKMYMNVLNPIVTLTLFRNYGYDISHDVAVMLSRYSDGKIRTFVKFFKLFDTQKITSKDVLQMIEQRMENIKFYNKKIERWYRIWMNIAKFYNKIIFIDENIIDKLLRLFGRITSTDQLVSNDDLIKNTLENAIHKLRAENHIPYDISLKICKEICSLLEDDTLLNLPKIELCRVLNPPLFVFHKDLHSSAYTLDEILENIEKIDKYMEVKNE